jgi:hypothetical protein
MVLKNTQDDGVKKAQDATGLQGPEYDTDVVNPRVMYSATTKRNILGHG